jgi:WD40 repeat protein
MTDIKTKPNRVLSKYVVTQSVVTNTNGRSNKTTTNSTDIIEKIPTANQTLSFQNDIFKRPSIPINATSKSVEAMKNGISKNSHNHCQPCDPNYKVCQHIRVFGWELDKCADCNKKLIGRLEQEQEQANIAIEEDASLSKIQLAAACHERAVTIQWLIAFTFDHNCWSWPTWQVVRDIVIPSTISTRCRYSDLLEMKPYVGHAKIFISHCWGSKWGDLVCAAAHGARNDRLVWVDIFAVRQWPGNGADLDFRGVIDRCDAVIVAVSRVDALTTFMPNKQHHLAFLSSDAGELAQKIMAFFRLWCIVELAAAIERKKPVVIKGGVAKKEEDGTYFYDTNGMKIMLDNLTHMINSEAAQCAVSADFDREMARIRGMEGGVDRINCVVVGVLEGAQHSVSANVPEVDAFVCGEPESLRGMGLDLRCTGQERNRAMEVIAVASGGGRVEVLEELWKGWGLSAALDANVGETKTAAIATGTKLSSSSSKWICELIDESKAIWIACKGGHITVLKKLLNCPGININVIGSSGSTPLMMAKQGQHQEIIELLEKNGATERITNVRRGSLIQSVEASMYGKGTDPFGESIRRRIAELSKGFVGREWLSQMVVDELYGDSTITDAVDEDESTSRWKVKQISVKKRIVVIYGDSGTGKTAFVCRVLDHSFCIQQGGSWKKLHGRILARHMCTVNDSDSLDPVLWAKSLAGQIFEKIEAAKEILQVLNMSGHQDRKSWLVWLQEQDSTRKILNECLIPMLKIVGIEDILNGLDTIWLDSLDEASTLGVLRGGGNHIDTVVTMLLEYLDRWPKWIKFVATSRPDEVTRQLLQPLSGAKIDVKDQHNLNDIKNYVTSKIGQNANKKMVIEKICNSAAGVFMYASEVLRQYEEDSSISLDTLPTGLSELYMTRYRRTFKDDEDLDEFHAHSGLLLAMLMSSRGPLSVEMVKNIGITFECDDAWLIARQNHLEFVQRMCVGSLVEVGLLQFSHRSFPDWLSTNEKYKVEHNNGEKLLGDVCLNIIKNKMKNIDTIMMHYSLKHVVTHLVESNRKGEARELLLDVTFLLARATDSTGLIRDCKWFEDDRVITLVGRAVGYSSNDLRKDPRRIVGQLVGRLMWSAAIDNNINNLRNRLIEQSYDFGWWCPIRRTMEQAGGACIRQLLGHTKEIYSVAYSSDGLSAVSGSKDKTIRLWNIESGETIKMFQGHMHGVTSVAFSSNNKQIISGSYDNTVHLWNIDSGKIVKILKTPQLSHTNYVTSVAFSANNKYIASGSKDNTLCLWNVDTGKIVKISKSHIDQVTSVAFSSDNKLIISGADDKTVHLWNIESDETIKIFEGHTSGVKSVAFSSNDKYVTSGSEDCTVRLWDVEFDESIQVFQGHTGTVTSVIFPLVNLCTSNEYTYIISGSKDRTIRLWNIELGECIKILEGHTNSVLSVASSTNYLISGACDNTLRLWDIESVDTIKLIKGHTDYVTSIAFSSNNQYIVSGSRDKTVRLWNVETGECIKILNGHANVVRSVAFSPNTENVASGSYDNTVRLWNVESGECIQILQGHTSGGVESVAFSEDGYYIISEEGYPGKEKRVWDAYSGECLLVIPKGKSLPARYTDKNVRSANAKIDLSILNESSTVVGFGNGKYAEISSDGMYAAAKEENTVHILSLH